MPYVQRDGQGAIVGRFARPQPGYAEEFVADDAAEHVLLAAKGAKRAAIDAQFAARLAAGFGHGGHVYQADEVSQGRIEAMGSLALRYKTAGGWDEDGWTALWAPADGFKFITAGNVLVAMTAQETFEFAELCGVHIARLRYRYRALKTALAGAATVEAVLAVDVAAGWP